MVKGISKRGQLRIIEALITAFLVIGSMIIVVELQRIPRTWITYESEDLEDLAFNLIAETADSVLTSELTNQSGLWENNIFWALRTMLPPTLYFNMTIYKVSISEDASVSLAMMNRVPITNIQSEDYEKLAESASATYILTLPDGTVCMVVLTLMRSRGG